MAQAGYEAVAGGVSPAATARSGSGNGLCALLVIDMQVGVMHNCWDAEGVLRRTARLTERARAAAAPVIWIQDEDDFRRGSAEWQVAPPLAPSPDEDRIFKTRRDAFLLPDLSRVLAGHGVRRLVVAGAQSDLCVRTTAQRAAAEGYDVTLAGDCHTTTDVEHGGVGIAARQIIAHTNYCFAGLRYPGQHFDVVAHDLVRFTPA
jgi:nicotinamidase-related amidase